VTRIATETPVSLLVVTYNRGDLTRRCLSTSLANTGYPYRLLSVDNASTDGVADYIGELKPVYRQINSENEGYAKALNDMLAIRADNAEFVCVLDPDLLLSEGWLHRLVVTNRMIPNAGLSSVHCVLDFPPAKEVYGVTVHPRDEVYGVKFLHRSVLHKVGHFYTGFGRYGQEDVDYNLRCKMAGLVNYYVSDVTCVHAGEDSGEDTPYRRFKWAELEKANILWAERKKYLLETGDYYWDGS
jgi:GT2 family glycosyltransferase